MKNEKYAGSFAEARKEPAGETPATSAANAVKWYDRKLLIRSGLVGLMFFIVLLVLVKRAEPPVGYVFERMPTISGIYKCCDAGGRYSRSWVGNEVVECSRFSYFQLGTPRNDCGLKDQLDGQAVLVTQSLIPTYRGHYPLVSEISSGGTKFYIKDDQQMRKLWISGSRWDATVGLTLALIFHFCQWIWLNRSAKQYKGEES